MHAATEENRNQILVENGAPKSNKKKGKNRKQNQKSVVPEQNHNEKPLKSTIDCPNGRTVVATENDQCLKDTLGSERSVKENGCAKNDHHNGENGEMPEPVIVKKSRSRNQRKRHQKSVQNALQSGTENNTNDPISEPGSSGKITNNINNGPELDVVTSVPNGTDSFPLASIEPNHVSQAIASGSSSPPQSKTQSKSSSPSSALSSQSSTLSPGSSMSPIPSPSTSTWLPTPGPSTSKTASNSINEQISNRSESQGLEIEKENAKCATVSPVREEATVPVEKECAVEDIERKNIVIEYKQYESELQMQDIMRLIQSELSEPYSIYTYRYFIYNWPKLCFLAAHGDEYVGAIVCKLDMHMNVKRGYIAMLAVKKEYRKMKIGTTLVEKAIEAMLADNADEVVLETEMKNTPALRLYENLGFVRDKRLFRYYLNGVDALRLKLWFR